MAGRIRAVTFDPNRVGMYLKERVRKSKNKDKKALYVDQTVTGYNNGRVRGR